MYVYTLKKTRNIMQIQCCIKLLSNANFSGMCLSDYTLKCHVLNLEQEIQHMMASDDKE